MSELTHALADLDEEKAKKLVCEKVDAGVDPMSIVDECRKGMDIVGGRYKGKLNTDNCNLISGTIIWGRSIFCVWFGEIQTGKRYDLGCINASYDNKLNSFDIDLSTSLNVPIAYNDIIYNKGVHDGS